jgi:hypothetical protein
MDHPLFGRPVLDEMGFVASQHLDFVRDNSTMHDFSHIGEELLDMGKQPLGALSKLLLMPVAIPEFIEDLADVLALAKKNTWSVGSKRSCTRLINIKVMYSGANMMTGTRTCYSPT